MTEKTDIMSIGEVATYLDYKANSSVYSLMHRDADFPKPFELGIKNFWYREEIVAWQEARITKAAQNRKSYQHRESYNG